MLRALLLLAPFVLVACDSTSPFDPEIDVVDISRGDLREARDRWEASGVEDYTMTLVRACFCAQESTGPFEIRVESGELASVRYQGAEVGLDRAETVKSLFDVLEAAFDTGADDIRAAFDAETGHLLRLSIDYIEEAVDDELGYTVTAFRPG